MSREIKFRAWDKEDCVMRTVLGFSLYHGAVSVDIGNGRYLQDDSSRFDLMQYTGLEDKNGTEVYEGDVVKGRYYAGYNIGIKGIIGNVCWTSASFKVNGVKQYEGTKAGLDWSFEVIGNIYEHPHLIEEETE